MTTAIDIGFTETVKAIQTRKGSRQAYANLKWQSEITVAFTSLKCAVCFVSTVNAQGYPYTQKGGPAGRVMDRNTIAFADFKGNRFISQVIIPRTFFFDRFYSGL